MDDVIKRVIYLDKLFPEYLIALHSEPRISYPNDPLPEEPPSVCLVYKIRYQMGKDEWLYEYVGVRVI